MPIHILEYQLSTYENVDVVQVANFTEKKEKSFFDPHFTSQDKIKNSETLLCIYRTWPNISLNIIGLHLKMLMKFK